MSAPASPPITWSRIARRIRVPLGFGFAAFYLWRARPSWTSLAVGAVIALLGIFIRAVASGHVEKNRVLATSGPYAYVRNPLYLGSIIIGVGFTIAARDLWVLIAIVLLFVAIYVPVIRSEEAFLRSQFPQYDDYASTRAQPASPHTAVPSNHQGVLARVILQPSRIQFVAGRCGHAGGACR